MIHMGAIEVKIGEEREIRNNCRGPLNSTFQRVLVIGGSGGSSSSSVMPDTHEVGGGSEEEEDEDDVRQPHREGGSVGRSSGGEFRRWRWRGGDVMGPS
ncbi:hypothetical protein QJS04_geneDACA007040 [Acorus gramineus]|uniref:Uncharacterized protein n=1 Tax=Acorus gramineus TaxID=55184 RepID=A0AAV9BL45_ACOGR|nr:hypothetical protein QJS04_geneDACA007040 [Acorus gramineus]